MLALLAPNRSELMATSSGPSLRPSTDPKALAKVFTRSVLLHTKSNLWENIFNISSEHFLAFVIVHFDGRKEFKELCRFH